METARRMSSRLMRSSRWTSEQLADRLEQIGQQVEEIWRRVAAIEEQLGAVTAVRRVWGRR